MVKVIIRQLICEVLKNSAWLEFEFEMDFPPSPGMSINIKRGASVEVETVCYEIETQTYICYPEQYSVLRGDSCTFEEVVNQYKDDGFVEEKR